MKNNLNYRVGQIEKCYEQIDGKIDKILINHLPHLETRMGSLETKMNVLTAVNIGALVIAVIIAKYL